MSVQYLTRRSQPSRVYIAHRKREPPHPPIERRFLAEKHFLHDGVRRIGQHRAHAAMVIRIARVEWIDRSSGWPGSRARRSRAPRFRAMPRYRSMLAYATI